FEHQQIGPDKVTWDEERGLQKGLQSNDIDPSTIHQLLWTVEKGGKGITGSTDIALTVLRSEDSPFTMWGKNHPDETLLKRGGVLHIRVSPTKMARIFTQTTAPRTRDHAATSAEARSKVAPFPCMSEACDPSGAPRFPTAPPWLHADPLKPGQAA